ncbi:antirestriction protein ArdA [Pelagibius sp.]|uniref:antirestriction protein ArdA n=1 Tax=Pelagibius sp. TaxID=1931238 RepID=UPI003B513DBD
MAQETANDSAAGDAGSRDGNTPRIYAACLAAYNNGRLHGRWIDVTQDPEDIQAEIAQMLAASPIPGAEEWAIHDYEGFEGARLEEYSGIEKTHALALFIVEHGKLGAKVLEQFGGDLDDTKAAFEEYAGEHRSLADFAQELTEETTEIPQSLVNYIDYETMARDMELNGDVFTVELGFDEVHVFWSR